MSKLKNITNNMLCLQAFRTTTPVVNGVSQEILLVLKPKEEVEESLWLVSDNTDESFNEDLIDDAIAKNLLTRLA